MGRTHFVAKVADGPSALVKRASKRTQATVLTEMVALKMPPALESIPVEITIVEM